MKRIVKYIKGLNTKYRVEFYIPESRRSDRPVNHLSSEAFTSYLSVLGHTDIYYSESKGWVKISNETKID